MSDISNDLNETYFRWMYHIMYEEDTPLDLGHYWSKEKVLHHVDRTPFVYTKIMDKNRESDGRNLRFLFLKKMGLSVNPEDEPYISIVKQRGETASILEVIIALAIRMEQEIAADSGLGDRTGFWASKMLYSLGVRGYHNFNYDEKEVEERLQKFIKGDYAPNGEGSLFWFQGRIIADSIDCRKMDIWQQMNKWIDPYIE